MTGQGYDAIVVGAGMVGLAHAYLLAREGGKVLVLERGEAADGASLRNFGVIGVVGQPLGPRREFALRSRALWRELLAETGIWHHQGGSLQLAYSEDELAVLTEFLVQADEPTLGTLLTPAEVVCASPGVRAEGLIGAFRSATEMVVDPRITVAALAAHLAQRYGVEFRFRAAVEAIAPGEVRFTGGVARAARVFVCLGADLGGLFPDLVASEGLGRCRLRMLRLEAPAAPVGSQLCGALTLLHFGSFAKCPTLPALRTRLEAEFPGQMAHGVHAMVVQHGDGTLTVGDSHQYGNGEAFDPAVVERLILEAADRFLPVADLAVLERWEGSYLTHPTKPYLVSEPMPGVQTVTCFGAGMTLSLGTAERVIGGQPTIA
ncbi:MAG: TIGR03364 family FAD-dependent oxidoreductase [Fimbriimonas sp.]